MPVTCAVQVQMSKIRTALTPGAETLLKKGRRLTEHTLDTCQLKRIKAAAVCTHSHTHTYSLSCSGLHSHTHPLGCCNMHFEIHLANAEQPSTVPLHAQSLRPLYACSHLSVPCHAQNLGISNMHSFWGGMGYMHSFQGLRVKQAHYFQCMIFVVGTQQWLANL